MGYSNVRIITQTPWQPWWIAAKPSLEILHNLWEIENLTHYMLQLSVARALCDKIGSIHNKHLQNTHVSHNTMKYAKSLYIVYYIINPYSCQIDMSVIRVTGNVMVVQWCFIFSLVNGKTETLDIYGVDGIWIHIYLFIEILTLFSSSTHAWAITELPLRFSQYQEAILEPQNWPSYKYRKWIKWLIFLGVLIFGSALLLKQRGRLFSCQRKLKVVFLHSNKGKLWKAIVI